MVRSSEQVQETRTPRSRVSGPFFSPGRGPVRVGGDGSGWVYARALIPPSEALSSPRFEPDP